MLYERFLADALRAALVLGLGLAAMPLLRRASSSARRLVLTVALTGALLVPLLSAFAPALYLGGRFAASPSPASALVEDSIAVAPSAPESATRASASTFAPETKTAKLISWTVALGVSWVVGALVVVVRMTGGMLKAYAIVRRSKLIASWSRAVREAEAVTGLRADVRATSELASPAVAGVLSPVVLVPDSSEGWTEQRRRAVLLHELAHVRQRDGLVHVVSNLACAAHWFNPLAWLVARRLRLERELAADDAVIAAGAQASTYAEDLLALSGMMPDNEEVPSGALGMAGKSELVTRIQALLEARRARRPLGAAQSTLVALGGGAVVFAAACATTAPAPVDTPAPSATTDRAPAPSSSGSTVDPGLQQLADEELDRMIHDWSAEAGTILVLDPSSGAVIANAGRAHGKPANVAFESAYLTGSTLKPLTLAAALEERVVAVGDVFDCEHGSFKYGGEVLEDSGDNGKLSVSEMLAVSSNVGFAKVFDRLGGERLHHWLSAFHFGVAPAIEGASAGKAPERVGDKTFAGAMLAIGESMATTPLALALAYATLANGGNYVAPRLRVSSKAAAPERVLHEETARAVVTLLEDAVNAPRATGTLAKIDGARVAGKTGTAVWKVDGKKVAYSSFVGLVPATAPRYVILVGVEQPKDEASGGKVAAPVFARVARRALER